MAGLTLSAEDFATITTQLERASGLVFDSSRREALVVGVAERMAATGDSDVGNYLQRLSEAAELQRLVEELTVPETQFLRNPPQMAALREHLLPSLVAAAAREGRPLRVWSAGCSTGEEAYSLALLTRPLALSQSVPLQIVATDISSRALRAAEAAHYSDRAVQLMSKADRERCLLPRQSAKERFQVRPELREAVEFRRHNLIADPPPFTPGEADLILCRNVTIYFSRSTTAKVARRLHAALRPGGYLLLGHAETLWQICDEFVLSRFGDAFVYQRPETPAGRSSRPPAANRPAPAKPRRNSRPLPIASPAEGRPARSRPDPDDVAALRRTILAGEHAHAADLAARLAESVPLQPEHHYLLGLALANLGRDFEASVSLRRAVYLDPGHGLAQFLLGGTLERLGEPVAAARCYRAAAQVLSQRPGQRPVAELGGRRTAELLELCRTFAARAESAGQGPGSGRTTAASGE